MPIIFSYPQISTVSNQDLFVISRTSSGIPQTKSVEAEDISTYVKSTVDLNFEGDTGSAVVNLNTQSLSIEGTANEIETVATQGNSRGIITIGLPDNVTITNNLEVNGTTRLTVLSFANDTAAGAGGITSGTLYQTDGTGAAPLNVAGILMIKQ